MIFDVYYPIRIKDKKTNKERLVPGTKPCPQEWSKIVETILKNEKWNAQIDEYRKTGDAGLKSALPSICFVGRSTTTRQASAMTPTQLFMIDIDHCKDPRGAWQKMFDQVGNEWICDNVMTAHISPGGEGLHIILKQMGYPTLIENMDAANEIFDFGQYGDYDTKVKDFSRVSFAFKYDETLFENAALYLETEPDLGDALVNDFKDEEGGKKSKSDDMPQLTEEEIAKYKEVQWRGQPVLPILERYIQVQGAPKEGDGEIHNYYNELIKYFRYLTSNDKVCLFAILPRFGHSAEECWGSLKSICRVNTLSKLPLDFYIFLRDNGFYKARNNKEASKLEKYMLSDDAGGEPLVIPYLPPVFREFVKCAPKDFVIPAINALMAILGTLTSYVKAKYPYDHKWHTTSFFSIIIAPPSTGKGFVGQYMDLLFEDLRLRDFISKAREQIYNNVLSQKGANDKSPEKPKVSIRLMPPKNSEAELLEKQSFNQGYHMFTYAAEMDSWAKGVKAAGGNKDDIIRVAWDNESYGQYFKNANTFKGDVNLYWNVLITGTPKQIEKYFKDVENGLVTRCCFTPIENQEFVMAPKWKELTQKDISRIREFMKRCDENSYEKPCTTTPADIMEVSENAEAFDKEVDWRFQFKERQEVDMDWIMPTINAFQEEQMKKALKDLDKARDVFRRRVGVRGFRLALLCYCLYKRPNKPDLDKCKAFVNWWMHQDLENMVKMWGSRYNKETEVMPNLTQRKVFTELNTEFTREDVYVVCVRQGIKSPVKQIIYGWTKQGFITKVGDNKYKKAKQYES